MGTYSPKTVNSSLAPVPDVNTVWDRKHILVALTCDAIVEFASFYKSWRCIAGAHGEIAQRWRFLGRTVGQEKEQRQESLCGQGRQSEHREGVVVSPCRQVRSYDTRDEEARDCDIITLLGWWFRLASCRQRSGRGSWMCVFGYIIVRRCGWFLRRSRVSVAFLVLDNNSCIVGICFFM